MAAWSAVMLLEDAVFWIDRLTGMGTDKVVARLSKPYVKPSDEDG
jgi:hypothetical protein